MDVTLNNNQKLFVINTGNSVSCLGFFVVFSQGLELARRLAAAGKEFFKLSDTEVGTLKQYGQYQQMLATYQTINDPKTWFDGRTPLKVQVILDSVRKHGDIVRIFYGENGRDWLEEFDTIGKVGRSMGPMRVPLLIKRGESGGAAILTSDIVKIVHVASGSELYRHPSYSLPKMQIEEAPDYEKSSGYTHSVLVEGKTGEMQCHANFKSKAQAEHWVAFMSGKTNDLPSKK